VTPTGASSTIAYRVPARARRRTPAFPLALVLMGTTGFALSIPATASAASFGHPNITAAEATFKIPMAEAATWTLNLWSHGTLEGSATGTSGMLTIIVPITSDCAFQADVRATTPPAHPFYFAGIRATVPGCGTRTPVHRIAGHIYLCTAGSPTTTEESGGTLAATGPMVVTTQPNPVIPATVTVGSYSMSADSPDGFTFVLCGGTATIGAGGQTASETVAVPIGGTGVGLFYVTGPPVAAGGTGPPVAAGGVTNGSNPGAPATVAAGSSVVTGTPAQTTDAAATPVAGSQLAFTGMDAAPPALTGLLMIALGSLLIIFSRARRESHPRPARTGAAAPPVPRRP